jgi:hypothetical protein
MELLCIQDIKCSVGYRENRKELRTEQDPTDVFGPLDILYLLSWDHFMNVSIISATMDPVTTHPGSNFTISPFATLLQPTHTFENPPKDLDVLIIPGGS